MNFLPAWPLAVLVPLLVGGILLGAWLSWRNSAELSSALRWALLTLRVLLLGGISWCLLNPGHWLPQNEATQRKWLLVLDRSGSMQTKEADGTRWNTAVNLATELAPLAPDSNPVEILTAGKTLAEQPVSSLPSLKENLAKLTPDEMATDLTGSLTDALVRSSARGQSVAGIILLSDGHNTVETPLAEITMRARGLNVPIHAVTIGGDVATKDLLVQAQRRQVICFPGQSTTLPIFISSHGLGPLKFPLQLLDASGKEVSSQEITLPADGSQVVNFTVKGPTEATIYQVKAAALPEEVSAGNNTDSLRVLPLPGKTKIFLAEGAPYWDSKFLAQLLRQQAHLQIKSVHRLSDTRFFTITSEQAKPVESASDTFPSTAAELSGYDVIVFGKGAEYFLTPERCELLRAYVRDQGGAVCFSRGKAYAGKLPALEIMEPVVWGEGKSGDFHFSPAPEGEAVGIFGNVLPAATAPVWDGLPALKDGASVESVRPFTRVLALGKPVSSATTGSFPVLCARRYGQGVVGLLNADGLWKWDFFPEARAQGNMYAEFWVQYLQWMTTYAEFLPGQDFALRLDSVQPKQGDPVRATIGYRGASLTAEPVLHLRDATGATIAKLGAASATGPDGRKQWRASVPTTQAGEQTLRLEDASGKPLNGPEVALRVLAPPGEMEQLNADPVYLQKLTSETGGKLWTAESLRASARELLAPPPPLVRQGLNEWKPSWNTPWLALALAAAAALEWIIRRRQGLV